MAEYGRKLVEAAAAQSATALWIALNRAGPGKMPDREGLDSVGRAALLAFLDALIESGPSPRIAGALLNAQVNRTPIFPAIVDALRTEIEAAHE